MKLKTFLITLLSLFIISNCARLPKPSEDIKEKLTKIIKEIEKDTVFLIKKDSSFYKAYIKCVKNKPVLVQPKRKQNFQSNDLTPVKRSGKYLKPPNVNLKDGVLSVACESKARELFHKWKEKFVQEHKETTKTITLPPKLIPRPLSWWQKLWIGLGKILFLVGVVWLLKKISWKSLFKLLNPL
ncbi:conserved exported hypothetical protein [Tenacibaculum maritimum]|uniref:hypothetical protein n=1 Tax=Tenacibaculum maritimum TaxID=107401 RepID=UPI0012E45BE8|nr:hypothetical protein [Tenacibaculum maritimum]CAA0153008.1 conserved exported hypothetical protein [Tenacibaculum maritimum]CAA0207807.1 conserved exported hypothetical protein [Tenacibaculum maritimum]